MKIVYIGPHEGVIVPLPLGGEITAKHGEEVTLPDSLAVRLLEQTTNWEKPKGGAKQ